MGSALNFKTLLTSITEWYKAGETGKILQAACLYLEENTHLPHPAVFALISESIVNQVPPKYKTGELASQIALTLYFVGILVYIYASPTVKMFIGIIVLTSTATIGIPMIIFGLFCLIFRTLKVATGPTAQSVKTGAEMMLLLTFISFVGLATCFASGYIQAGKMHSFLCAIGALVLVATVPVAIVKKSTTSAIGLGSLIVGALALLAAGQIGYINRSQFKLFRMGALSRFSSVPLETLTAQLNVVETENFTKDFRDLAMSYINEPEKAIENVVYGDYTHWETSVCMALTVLTIYMILVNYFNHGAGPLYYRAQGNMEATAVNGKKSLEEYYTVFGRLTWKSAFTAPAVTPIFTVTATTEVMIYFYLSWYNGNPLFIPHLLIAIVVIPVSAIWWHMTTGRAWFIHGTNVQARVKSQNGPIAYDTPEFENLRGAILSEARFVFFTAVALRLGLCYLKGPSAQSAIFVVMTVYALWEYMSVGKEVFSEEQQNSELFAVSSVLGIPITVLSQKIMMKFHTFYTLAPKKTTGKVQGVNIEQLGY